MPQDFMLWFWRPFAEFLGAVLLISMICAIIGALFVVARMVEWFKEWRKDGGKF